VIDWTKYPDFSPMEFRCKETGENKMEKEFMDRLQRLRTAYGKAMPITSGYRSVNHTLERRKLAPGPHSTGKAVDIHCSGEDAYTIIRLALTFGFTGIGVCQKKDGARFIHLDTLPRKAFWSY